MRRGVAPVLVAWLVLLAGCTAEVEPRPLTTAEAERLALMRFTNFTRQTADIALTVPAPGGRLRLTGRVDFVNHRGYAALSTEGRTDQDSSGLLRWNLTVLAFRPGSGDRTVDPPPADGWQMRSLNARGAELDAALRLALDLAADRPDNAQLLAQSSARWLRTDTVGTTQVDVLEGPRQAGPAPSTPTQQARLRYWLDANGWLHRVEARLGTQQESAVLDLTGPGAPVPPVPEIGTR